MACGGCKPWHAHDLFDVLYLSLEHSVFAFLSLLCATDHVVDMCNLAFVSHPLFTGTRRLAAVSLVAAPLSSSSSSVASCLVRCRATRLRTRMRPRPVPLAQGQALREAEAAAVAVSPLRRAESAATPRRAAPAKELIPRAMAALVKSSGPSRH
jgi:hypothetical protein